MPDNRLRYEETRPSLKSLVETGLELSVSVSTSALAGYTVELAYSSEIDNNEGVSL